MKDNLFELLLHLFETSLTQLQESHKSTEQEGQTEAAEETTSSNQQQMLHLQSAHPHSSRIMTYHEQMKLSKASYQFLMRMQLWQIIDADLFESIMNQLQFSESRIVTLQETKWTIRTLLEAQLDAKQLAFLDLVLYQKEDELVMQ